jgi:tRNA(fMet)-specific endonuclease VapC
VPFILDTDHLSVLQWREQPAYDRLIDRLDQIPPDDLATTIVSFQEQVQGWLAYLARAKSPDQVVRAYARLEAIWRAFLRMNVLRVFPASSSKIGRYDLVRPVPSDTADR